MSAREPWAPVIESKGHRPGCDVEPWFTGNAYRGDRRGRRNGQPFQWWVILCNDPDCPGRWIATHDAITAGLGIPNALIPGSDDE